VVQKQGRDLYGSDRILEVAARDGRLPSDELKTELQLLPSITIDWSSLKITREAIACASCSAWTAQTSDTDPSETVTIWVAGCHQPSLSVEPNTTSLLPNDDFDIEKSTSERHRGEERSGRGRNGAGGEHGRTPLHRNNGIVFVGSDVIGAGDLCPIVARKFRAGGFLRRQTKYGDGPTKLRRLV